MSDAENTESAIDRLAGLSEEQLLVLATMTDEELTTLAGLEASVVGGVEDVVALPDSSPAASSVLIELSEDEIEALSALTGDELTALVALTPEERAALAETAPVETVELCEDEIIEILASVNGEIGRAEAFIAKGNGRLASKVCVSARALLDSVSGENENADLYAELDLVAERAEALPVPYATFPNPAHLTED